MRSFGGGYRGAGRDRFMRVMRALSGHYEGGWEMASTDGPAALRQRGEKRLATSSHLWYASNDAGHHAGSI